MDLNRPKPAVLIVDDDRSIQRMLADSLSKEGFSIFLEKDGEWALRTFEEKRIDVVLLDLLLPSLHGFEVARRIRLLPEGSKVPIIFMSGVYPSFPHKEETKETYGIADFLEKPLNLAGLKNTLKQILGPSYPLKEEEQQRRALLDQKPSEPFADDQAHQEADTVEKTARNSAIETIHGDLASKPFPEILADIFRWRATGALLLRREKIKKIVYFKNGRPFSVKSNLLSECLGKIMVREKMITENDCEESLRLMKQSGRQQGTVLIELGCINPNNLTYALSIQLQTKLLDIFGWTHGEYRFNPHAETPNEIISLDLTASQIIYEGIKRHYSEQRVRAALGDPGIEVESLYVHPARFPLLRFQDAGLDEEEDSLLLAIDGFKTVGTLIAMRIISPLATLRFIYAMRCSQMIELKKEAAKGSVKSQFVKAVLSNDKSGLAEKPRQIQESKNQATKKLPYHSLDSTVLAEIPDFSEKDERENLAAIASSLKKKDYFQILGVSSEASKQEIEQAYLRLTRKYHPDQYCKSRSAEVSKLVLEIFETISLARDTLIDDAERQAYLSDLAQGVSQGPNNEISKILAAEGRFQKGEELLRKRKYQDAAKAFQEAVALYAEEGEFHSYWGWSLFQSNPKIHAQSAIEHIENGIRLNPLVDKSYLFLAYIYKSMGRPDRAEKQFEKALQCNANCVEALHELRLLGVAKK